MSKQLIVNNNNRIGILGENIIINEGNITAYYILNSVNYNIMKDRDREAAITSLEKMTNDLALKYPNIKFNIFKIDKSKSEDDVKRDLLKTMQKWDKSATSIPEIYEKNITKHNYEYCILRVNIDINHIGDVEMMSSKEIVKGIINKAFSTFRFKTQNVNMDFEKIASIEKDYFNTIRNYGTRLPKDLTFHMFISRLFPSYNISYNKDSYITKNMKSILGYVNQEIDPYFGYFIMHNQGVELFGYKAKETYGCMMRINALPEVINSDNFNLDIPGMGVYFEEIPRKKAKLMIKRSRANLEYEEESAQNIGIKDIGDLKETIRLSNIAIKNIDSGQAVANMSIPILLLGKSIEDIKQKRQNLISSLAENDIIATISLDQGKDFMDYYVNGICREYDFLGDARLALSFQLNSGPIIGVDVNSELSAPKIGYTV